VKPPVQQAYSYTVYVGSPFIPVLINNSITCSSATGSSPACLISNQLSGNHLVIQGTGTNLCDFTIQVDGSLVKNSNSKGCNTNPSAATATKAGGIGLPSKF
jgi:hypothetical protein